MTTFRGPSFNLVEEISFEAFRFGAGIAGRTAPLLVKGAVCHWPAWQNWSFDKLADLCDAQGSEVVSGFQTGLTEQGATRKKVDLSVAPYLRDLGVAAMQPPNPERALLSVDRRARLSPGAVFSLDWSGMDFVPDRVYHSTMGHAGAPAATAARLSDAAPVAGFAQDLERLPTQLASRIDELLPHRWVLHG